MVDIDLADVRRERIALPLLRDERPEWASASWRGSSPSGPGWPDRRRRTPSRAWTSPRRSRRRPIGFRPGARPAATAAGRPDPTPTPRCSSCRPSWHRHGVARRVISRVHPRPAPPGRLRARVLGLSGGHRLRARRVPRRRGDRSRAAAVRPDAVSDVVARVARRRRGGRAAARLRERAGRHQPDGRRLLRRPTDAGRERRSGAATSWPARGWWCSTTAR